MSLFSGKTTLLLDFDGTLGDTFLLHETAFLQTLSPYNLPFQYSDYIGQRTDEVFAHVFQKAGRTLDQQEQSRLVSAKRKAAHALYPTHLRFIAGAETFVQQAYRLGYQLYIGSSGSRQNIMAGIEGLGLAPFIKNVVTADDVQYGKPHPEVFTTLLHLAGIGPEQALVIEDAPSGIAAGLAAGVEVICIDPTQQIPPYEHHPAVFFKSFEILTKALIPAAKTSD